MKKPRELMTEEEDRARYVRNTNRIFLAGILISISSLIVRLLK